MGETYEIRIERQAGLAEDVMLLTRRDGLVTLGDLAQGLAPGQMRREDIWVRGDDDEAHVVAVASLGNRSSYRVTLENGLTFVSTYASTVVVARNRHSPHSLRSIEQLEPGDGVVVPRGKARLGSYDGRSWSSSMLDRGAFPREVLAGSRAWLRKVLRTTLLEPYGTIGDGIRSSVSTSDDNEVTLSWQAPNKWIGRQMQAILIPFADCMSEFDDRTLTLQVSHGDLTRLDEALKIIDGIYEEGECPVDKTIVDWLLSIADTHERAREVIPVATVEGVNRRTMIGLVMDPDHDTFVANGILHGGMRGSAERAFEEVA